MPIFSEAVRPRICFVNPPFLENFSRPQRSPAVTKSGTLYFPIALASAAGFAEQSGCDIDLIDAPALKWSEAEVIERVSTFNPTILVVDTSTPSIISDIAFCARARSALPNVFIILVGTHVSAVPEECLTVDPAVNAVAIGEYDATIVELSQALAQSVLIDEVAGLCVRKQGGIVKTSRRVPIADLDTLPMVSATYRRFLDISKYFNPNALHPMVTITTTRGCPNRCTFCVYPQVFYGHVVRRRSPTKVVDEIEFIQSAFPEVRSVFFEDDTFSASKEHCESICEEIIRRNIRLPWSANIRVDIEPNLLYLMRRAGCRNVCVGFESGEQTLLNNIKKGITVEQSFQFMKLSREAGLIVHGCFMVGLPGETRASMEKTLQVAMALAPDTAQFYPVMVYPGTEAYAWYESRNLLRTHDYSKWLTATGLHNTIIETEAISASELVDFCDKARRRFYLRPSYVLNRLGRVARDPRELHRTVKAGKTFLKYLIAGSDVDHE